ncbi:MAG: hypothetical protein IKA06_06320 [Clostridia bacterium]|nr:hypothetical protein [Clostridia bacterium]
MVWQHLSEWRILRKIKRGKETNRYIANHHDDLLATLTDRQKEILEKFDDCYAELMDLNEREIFTYAFRLGARIAIEVMSFEAQAEI